MIPESFAMRFHWTFQDVTAPSSPSPAPDVLGSPVDSDRISKPEEGDWTKFRFSAGVIAEVNSLVSFAFKSVERQLSSRIPFLDGDLRNKAVVISACNLTQGAVIIDAALREVARKQGIDILVIDALELACGRFGALGTDAQAIDDLYASVWGAGGTGSVGEEDYSDSEPVDYLGEDTRQLIDNILATSSAGVTNEPTRRIIYMRNFQAIYSIAKPLMTHLLRSLFDTPMPDNYPPVPYPPLVTKRADLMVFGMDNSSNTLVTGAHPSGIPKDYMFLSALFNAARNRGPFYPRCDGVPYPGAAVESERWLSSVSLEPIPFDAHFGNLVDELTTGALQTSVFADDVKVGMENEDWQKQSRAEQIRLMNRTLLCVCAEGVEDWLEEHLDEIASWDGAPSTEILSVQQAKTLLHVTLGLMAAAPPPGQDSECSKPFRTWLDESYWAYEQRKKVQEDWFKVPTVCQCAQCVQRGEYHMGHPIGHAEMVQEGAIVKPKDGETSIDDLTCGMSSHATDLKRCIVDIEDFQTTFSDIFVDPAIIESLQTIVSLPLLYPSYFNSGLLAKEAIGGILLYGPPGTGKTMLCRALAKSSRARMIHIKPSDVNDQWVGESEKYVAAVFELAYRLAPCIVFVDELDALFSKRNDCTRTWERNVLTEFMQGMDGLRSARKNQDKNFVVVGATNRPFDLDLAVLRRFPRRILVDMPNLQMRKAILASYLANEVLDDGVSTERLAIDTDGFSGSDLKNLCVAAALASVKDAIGPNWREAFDPPTPPRTPLSSLEETGGQSEDKKDDLEPKRPEGGREGSVDQEEERTPDLPARKITSANIRQAQLEVVKSNSVGGLEQLYRWHQAHTTAPEKRTTALFGSVPVVLRHPAARSNQARA